jgi:hypothetical protein
VKIGRNEFRGAGQHWGRRHGRRTGSVYLDRHGFILVVLFG